MINWTKIKLVAYWVATLLIVAETGTGAFWDILRVPAARSIISLGYPVYLLTILGIWKLLAAIVLIIPRFPLIKEWAYAGIFFDFTGAIASYAALGYGVSSWIIPAILLLIEIGSWVCRPDSRKLVGQPAYS